MKSHSFPIAIIAALAHAHDVPVVDTTSGSLIGFSPYPDVHAYFNIPFAAPPIGDLRFAPPKQFQPISKEPRDTTQLGPACYQITHLSAFSDKKGGPPESEDCLTINIWKPATATGKLPVLIWLYPGGFSEGGNSDAANNGQRFVAEQKDIIVVTVNYRLNIFGFPNTPGIPVKNPSLLDQRLAIEWLRDNIASFGGDPDRMVLGGQSAGSISAAYYAYQYVEDPIVTGLIELSGQPGLLPADDGSAWKAAVNASGCAKSEEEAEQVKCMRSLKPRELKRAVNPSNLVPVTAGSTGGMPAVDNAAVFSVEEYAIRGKEGRFAKLPLLVSNTQFEGDGVLPFDPIKGVDQQISNQLTEFGFHCPVASTAGYWSSHDAPVWRYLATNVFEELQPYPWMRAFHGSDLILLFANEYEFRYEDLGPTVKEAGRYLRNAVAAFVRDPKNGLSTFGWPRYTGEGNTLVKLFENRTAGATFSDPREYDGSCNAVPQ